MFSAGWLTQQNKGKVNSVQLLHKNRFPAVTPYLITFIRFCYISSAVLVEFDFVVYQRNEKHWLDLVKA